MQTVALIPCTKSKVTRACPAADLYWPSPTFRGAWKVATQAGQRPVILSAKYGALLPHWFIEPYDQTLAGASSTDQARWAATTCQQLHGLGLVYPEAVMVSYLSTPYAVYLVPLLMSFGVTVQEPLRGLRQGERLAWFKQQLTKKPAG